MTVDQESRVGQTQLIGMAGFNLRERMQGDGFYVSYLHPGQLPNPLGETALVRGSQYYILNGNHLEQYRERIDSWALCITYFLEHQDELASWSDEYEG
jgi:hypothetical protein